MTLDSAIRGGTYRITRFAPDGDDHFRLMELGFKVGSLVSVMQRTRYSGLMKVKLKGARYALSYFDAKQIEVEPSK